MIPNQEVRQLSSKFGIQVKRMEIVQNGVYRIVTSKGHEYCLKRMAYPPVQLRWIDKTLQQMQRKSSIRIGWRNPRERSGKRLFVKWQRESPPFVLIPWLRGAWPSPNSNMQMRACGTLLAKFHQAGKKIKITKSGRQNMMGKWPSYLREEQNTLRKVIHKAKRNGFHSPLDHLLQKHGSEILQMARASIRTLRNSNYKSICRKTKATLCHGDCGPTNIIRTRKGMYLIDFETMRLDLRIYDLYRLIFNSCKDHNWNFDIAQSILDGYQKVYKLNRSDYRLLKILLRFPRGMCKLVEHYDEKSPKDKLQIERDFPKVLAHERRRSAFLKKLDIYAG
ncbi:CotS family spore coat protein [Melghirimyces profundicolus]|uniref:CotS family spore coat protein n=1 Tax=Melghirimyces profundicolus TaxID=1242148 RepID=A0A2T6C0K6_9BACL|nr:phosphotransferase [Melghirimyces profundicolus]PTX61856.1 CotS family spore coat protein [Melghirimyces profundicolus]